MINNFNQDENFNANKLYYDKYLKYKRKYVKLNISGGMSDDIFQAFKENFKGYKIPIINYESKPTNPTSGYPQSLLPEVEFRKKLDSMIQYLKEQRTRLEEIKLKIKKEQDELREQQRIVKEEEERLQKIAAELERKQKEEQEKQEKLAAEREIKHKQEMEKKRIDDEILLKIEESINTFELELGEFSNVESSNEGKRLQYDEYKKQLQRFEKTYTPENYTKKVAEFTKKLEEYDFFFFYSKLRKMIDSSYIKLIINISDKILQVPIGSGATSQIYSYNDGKNKYALSLQDEPIYDTNEILLLIYLNQIKLGNAADCTEAQMPVFSEFINILFDFENLKYYLCYKLYTDDLLNYLKFLNYQYDDNKTNITQILNTITENLDKKFKKLLEINYICLDIKLENILVSYNKLTYKYSEIVLHDYDLTGCCQKDNATIPNCTISDKEKKFLEIYYKLIIYFRCKHNKYIKDNRTRIRKFKYLPILLYEEYFKGISDELLESFFIYIFKDRKKPDHKATPLEVDEKEPTYKRILYYFNNYIIWFLKYYDLPTLDDYSAKQFKDIIKGIVNDKINFQLEYISDILHFN